ncbi:MAG: PepSY-like domain-containing protein [Chitinophagaceae bacterium]|nr:PepSY-like domain-containing protein [Chitinophagaceae bacterium]
MNTIKKNKAIILATLFLLPYALTAQDRTIPATEVPAAIQSYVKTHFPNQSIAKAKIDVEGTKNEYEIKLDDKTELEFDSKYRIKKIESKNALPSGIFPAKIRKYVKANYPNNVIINWEIEEKHQEVELDNDIQLEFTLKGTFIRIDN